MNLYKELKNFATRNNGRLITTEISILKQCKSVNFECHLGHKWQITINKAFSSPWCPECSGTKTERNTIEMMQKIAKSRGGKCLSEVYKNSESKLEWECAKGHRWKANAHSVKNKKSWCKICKNNAQKNTIEDMHKLAAKKGGKCISTEYVLNNVHLEWECAKGHRWMAWPSNITMGEWCPHCKKEDEKLTIEEMQKIAKSRGGKCLSDTYITGLDNLKWECAKGHQWEAPGIRVKHSKSWCPKCANNQRLSIEDVRKVAIDRGGTLLSEEYKNTKEKLKWKCSKGHVFELPFTKVKHRGQWCKICRKQNERT